jgi:DNA-binding NarL/FixJ family response regulator
VRVVIAEDSLLLREGIVRVLAAAGFDVAGEAGDAETLLAQVRAQHPDVAVIDIRMPPHHVDEGLVAARTIRAEHAGVGVLLLSHYVDERYVLGLLEDGSAGAGYLLKDRVADADAFAEAVRRVGMGGSALDPEVVAHLLERRPGPTEEALGALTPREGEVMELMAEGLSNVAIAVRLAITERGVERHITAIFEKLGLDLDGDSHRRVLAVLRYVRAAELAP